MKDKFQTTKFFLSCIYIGFVNLQYEKVEKYLEIKSV